MIDLAASDTIDFGVGDVLEASTNICRGDIVIFERIAASKVVIVSVEEKEIDNTDSIKYRVDKGREPGTIKLKFV
jgi:hypothetical protein